MTSIAIYAEGGGDTSHQRAELRQGLDALLGCSKDKARARRMGWKLVCAGGRQATYEAFVNAITTNPSDINVLLVDAEGPVAHKKGAKPADALVRVWHLRDRDHWDFESVPPEQVHLMVQTMEAWILADAEGLARYYGKDFRASALSLRQNLEEEPKDGLLKQLVAATKDTTKGEYHKIKHASAILKLIDPSKVALRCPRFKLFTDWLDQTIAGA